MQERINEPDWKIFKDVRQAALQRFCDQILAGIARLSAEPEKTAHERYLAVFRFVHDRNHEIAIAFDDIRRSSAVRMLGCMQSLHLLTEEELNRFSPETRNSVVNLVEIYSM